MHTAFRELCTKQWVKSVIREVTQPRELTDGLRTSGYGSKVYVYGGTSVIVGYEVQGVKDSSLSQISSDECDIYLITVPERRSEGKINTFETIKWLKKGGEQVHEISINMEAK